MSNVKFDDRELQKIIKELKQKIPNIKVGILGDNVARDGEMNNAEIGACHEFGTERVTASYLGGIFKTKTQHIPQRSFLRMPIQEKLASVIEKYPTQKKLSMAEMAHKIGAAAVSVIIAAFASGGFGTWEPLAGQTKNKQKDDHMKGNDILIDTGQLRDSIDYEIE